MTIGKTFWGIENLKPGKQFSFLYEQEEEKRLFLKRFFSFIADKQWNVLYLSNQSSKKILSEYIDISMDHLICGQVKDYFLSQDTFSPEKAIDRIIEEREGVFSTDHTDFCLLVDVDYLENREKELLQFEVLLNNSLLDERTIPISLYRIPTFPISLLAQLLLFHQYIITEQGIAINPNPLRDGILRANTLSALFHHSLDGLKKIQEKEEGIQWARDLCLVLFEDFPNPLFLSNESGEFVDFNHTWLSFTGKSLKEERGRGWLNGLKEKDQDTFLRKFQTGIEEMAPFETEFYLRHHSGEYRYILCSARPISRFSGHFSGFLFSCYDITHRQEKEEKRIKELEKELILLDQISGDESTRITASSLGLTSIKEGLPDVYQRLTADYSALMEDTVTEKIFGETTNVEEDKRAFVNKLGFLQASPRDLIDIHSSVLEAKSQEAPEEKAFLYVDEGRILALEIMGYLTSFYRRHCSGFQQ